MQSLFLPQWFSGEISKAIGWTLIHSLWQGLIAALVAGIIIACTRRTAAKYRYNLLGMVMVLFFAGAIFTFSVELNGPAESIVKVADQQLTITGSTIIANYEQPVSPDKTTWEQLAGFFNTNADFIVFIWCLVFLFHCVKLLTGIAGVQRIRNYKTHPSTEEWQTKLSALSKKLRLHKTILLIQSEIVKVPVAIGHFKPVILVPLGLLSNLPVEQVETILLHELAHIRRNDYLVNIIQRISEAVFFFNPAFLWISSLLRQEREACCDDVVVSHTAHKGNYLEALVSFQEYSSGASRYAMAIHNKKHYLLNRVKRMITRENKKLDSMEKIFLLAGFAVVTAFTFIPKNEATTKQTAGAANILKENLVTAPAETTKALPATLKTTRTEVKKQHVKPAKEETAGIVLIDTIPPNKQDEKEKAGNEHKQYRDMSSTINDDGKTKTETTSITQGNGKKITYTRINGKITGLTVDGKSIPESEFNNYAELLDNFEALRKQNKDRRLALDEQRKLFHSQRAENLKNRVQDHKLERKYMDLQKEYLHELNVHLKDKHDEKLELKKQEINKLLNQLKERKVGVPMLNGREIILNDIHTDNSIASDVSINANFNSGKVLTLNKVDALKKQPDVNLESKLFISGKNDLLLKTDVSGVIDQKINTTIEDIKVSGPRFYPGNKTVKPLFPNKATRTITDPGKANPEKPAPAGEYHKKRVTT